jgi:hypothetical protein
MIRRSFNKTIYNNVYSQYKPPDNKTHLQQSTHWALLGLSVYRFVFTTKVAFGAALILCASLLLQPVAFAYAEEPTEKTVENVGTAEVEDEPSSTEAEPSSAEETTDVTENASENIDDNADDEVISKNVVETAELDTDTDTEADLSSEMQTEPATTTDTVSATTTSTTSTVIEAEDEPSVDPIATTTVATTSQSIDVPTATSSQPTASTSSTSSNVTNNTVSSSSNQDATTTSSTASSTSVSSGSDESSGDGGLSTSTATSTVSTTTSLASNDISTMQTDSVFAFNKNECTEVEDGSFYCQKISSNTMADNDLFAAPDATGDMEIYVIQNGEQIQVTDNAVDDASPYYDQRSKTIVWHRLVNDRYQIISYDVENQTEVQLTDTSVNNMEPTKNGDYTVWQRWVQNNWEIILREGDVETQITDSIEHDIAPHIRGDLIIWNVRSSDGSQSLMTYDIGSESFNEIKDTDGVSVTNPRMLVMYEAQYQNGDTVMKGFDPVTGEIIPIERIPRDLPSDIPSPETTGEVRALPTTSQSEEELSSDSDLDTDEPVDSPVQYDKDDLVLNASSTATSTPTVEEVDFDLDLRPSDSQLATTTDGLVINQAAIPDVIVPEYTQKDVVEQASSTQHN